MIASSRRQPVGNSGGLDAPRRLVAELGGSRWRPFGSRIEIVAEDPKGRRFEVIELTSPGCPHEGHPGNQDDAKRHGNQNQQDAHWAGSKVRRLTLRAMTVRELTGIMIAAIRGLIVPVIASAAPIRL